MSKQKRLVLQILSNSTGHLTASDIYLEARKNINNISLGTVYRDLSELYSEGIISKFITSDGITVFDKTTMPHAHKHCIRCGRIEDYALPHLTELLDDTLDGQYVSSNISIDYICPSCIVKNQ